MFVERVILLSKVMTPMYIEELYELLESVFPVTNSTAEEANNFFNRRARALRLCFT